MSGKEKKKDSTLGIVSDVLVGLGALLPLPIILSFPMLIAGIIVGIVDLRINDDNFRHTASKLSVAVGIVCVVVISLRFI